MGTTSVMELTQAIDVFIKLQRRSRDQQHVLPCQYHIVGAHGVIEAVGGLFSTDHLVVAQESRISAM